MPREPTLAELADDLHEIKANTEALALRVDGLIERLDQRYVPREVYESRHHALRQEVALQLAELQRNHDALRSDHNRDITLVRVDMEKGDIQVMSHADTVAASASSEASGARRISWAAVVLLATVVVTALVGFLLTGPAQ